VGIVSTHLEKGGVAGRPEIEASVVDVVDVVDGRRVRHGVLDVLVGEPVLVRRRVDPSMNRDTKPRRLLEEPALARAIEVECR
jgi:hypothetical protein